jgi:hypothetical protein
MSRPLAAPLCRSALVAAIGAALVLFAPLARADAQPAPFAAGKPHEGGVLVKRDCVDCHARRYEGDHERIYLRLDRRVKSSAQLLAQVQRCNSELGKNYFPEEEEHVAAYLNLHYYHFAP